MKRMTTAVQGDECPRCGAEVITAGYDVLGEVAADIIADPTPLEQPAIIACVISGRALYRMERWGFDLRLGRKHWSTDERRMNQPDLVVPAHLCSGRFPGRLPSREDFEMFLEARTTEAFADRGEEKPSWMP